MMLLTNKKGSKPKLRAFSNLISSYFINKILANPLGHPLPFEEATGLHE